MNITDRITLHTPEMDEMRELMSEFSLDYSNKVHSIARRMECVNVSIDMNISDRISLKFHGMDEIKANLDEMDSYQQRVHGFIKRMEELCVKVENEINRTQNSSLAD